MRISTLIAGTTLSCWILTMAAMANDPPADSHPPEEVALTTVMYDIRGIGPCSQHGPFKLSILPFVDEEEAEYAGYECMNDSVHSLLVDHLYPDEFQYEGREIGLLNGDRLLVTAPAEVHGTIVALLDYIHAASSRKAILRWDVFEVKGSAPPEGKLAVAMVDMLVERGDAVLVQSRRESVPIGQTVRRHSERTHQVLAEWETEIAQQSVVQIPELRNLVAGMTLLVRVEDVPGGGAQRVRMIQRMVGDPELMVHNTDPTDLVVVETAVVEQSSHQILELHRAGATTLVGSGVLKTGEALVASAWSRNAAGVTGRITRLVLEQVDPPPQPLQHAGVETRLLDLSAFYWRGVSVPTTRAWRLQGRQGHEETVNYRDVASDNMEFPSGDSDWDQTVGAAIEPFEWEHGKAWQQENWMLMSGPPEKLAAAVESMSPRLLAKASVMLEWGIVDGSGAALAGGCLDLEQGDDGLFLVGEAISYLHGQEADVATGATVTRTDSVEAFDGLWLVAHANGPRGVELTLARNHLAGLDEIGMGRGSGGVRCSSRAICASLSPRTEAAMSWPSWRPDPATRSSGPGPRSVSGAAARAHCGSCLGQQARLAP